MPTEPEVVVTNPRLTTEKIDDMIAIAKMAIESSPLERFKAALGAHKGFVEDVEASVARLRTDLQIALTATDRSELLDAARRVANNVAAVCECWRVVRYNLARWTELDVTPLAIPLPPEGAPWPAKPNS